MAEPLSRRGVARAPTASKVRSMAAFIRNPLLAAGISTKKHAPDDGESYNPNNRMPPLEDRSLAGFARHAVQWVARQRKMGANSGWTILFWCFVVGTVIYRFLNNYIWPWKKDNITVKPRFRHGFADSHNILLGMPLSDTSGYDDVENRIMSSDKANFERPRLIAAEKSEKLADPARLVTMQLREFDNYAQTDFFTRSLHIADWVEPKKAKPSSPVTGSNVDAAAVRAFDQDRPLPTEAEVSPAKLDRSERADQFLHKGPIGSDSWFYHNFVKKASPSASSSSTDGGASSGTVPKDSRANPDYLHGIVRCTAITPLNNCVVDQQRPQAEVVRKMLTGLGPLHVLRDPLNAYMPVRLYMKKEKKQQLLCLGMGNCAALPNFIHRQYPHYSIDIVEADGGLVRTLRRYFGFKDLTGMDLHLEDPGEYVRRLSASMVPTDGHKLGNYDAVWVDLVDQTGNIPKEYARLEFISNIRDCMSGRGVLVMNIPNHDNRTLNTVVSNVRMVFDSKSVVLLHCATSENTVLMTFNDMLGKGYPKFGDCKDHESFKEVLKAWMSHYHEEKRMPLDILSEVKADSFQSLVPGKRYTVRSPQYMPR